MQTNDYPEEDTEDYRLPEAKVEDVIPKEQIAQTMFSYYMPFFNTTPKDLPLNMLPDVLL